MQMKERARLDPIIGQVAGRDDSICFAQQNSRLFDRLVGAQEERLGDREPECLGGCQIDDEIELDRLFDRQVSEDGGKSTLARFSTKTGRADVHG